MGKLVFDDSGWLDRAIEAGIYLKAYARKAEARRDALWGNSRVRVAIHTLGFDHAAVLPDRSPYAWQQIAHALRVCGWHVGRWGGGRTYAQAFASGKLPARCVLGSASHAGALVDGVLWDHRGTRQRLHWVLTPPGRESGVDLEDESNSDLVHRRRDNQNRHEVAGDQAHVEQSEAGRVLMARSRPTHRSLWVGSADCVTYKLLTYESMWVFADGSSLTFTLKGNTAIARTGKGRLARKVYRT